MRAKIAILLLVGVIGVVAHVTGYLKVATDAQRLASLLRDVGFWGYAIYVLGFVVLEPLGIPAVAFIVPASVVWPKGVALGLSFVGAMGASIAGFSFARFIARDWVRARLPSKLRKYDARLAEHGLKTVFVVRLLFFLVPPAHWMFGLSQVRFGPYLLGTSLGVLPGLVAMTYVGGSVAEWLARQPPWVWGAALFAIAVFAIGSRARRVRQIESGGRPPS